LACSGIHRKLGKITTNKKRPARTGRCSFPSHY
jgi:hypothetical protein